MRPEMKRRRWTVDRLVAVALGGAVGASIRWLVQLVWEGGELPWPVLTLNVVGSFALGVVLAEEWSHPQARLVLHDFAGIGVCGALTTFATFAVDAAALIDGGRAALGVAYVGASAAGTVVSIFAGAAMFRRVRALMLPLEEQP